MTQPVGGWRLAVGGEDEEGLRRRFRDLAREDGAAAPCFSLPPPHRRRGWPALRLALAAAVLAVAGAAGYLWRATPDRPLPYPIDLNAVTWNGPTDFLLRTPGAALLRELPTIGTGSGAAAPNPAVIDDTSGRNRS